MDHSDEPSGSDKPENGRFIRPKNRSANPGFPDSGASDNSGTLASSLAEPVDSALRIRFLLTPQTVWFPFL